MRATEVSWCQFSLCSRQCGVNTNTFSLIRDLPEIIDKKESDEGQSCKN